MELSTIAIITVGIGFTFSFVYGAYKLNSLDTEI